MAAYGHHSCVPAKFGFRYPTFWCLSEVKSLFENLGVDFGYLVSETRERIGLIPYIETITPNKMVLFGNPIVKVPSVPGGVPNETVVGPGEIIFPVYLNEFENSVTSFQKVLENKSTTDFNNASISGVTSIEVYLNNRIAAWNDSNPQNQLIDDKEHKKVPFDTKITDWIPIITRGRRLDKSTRIWMDFVMFRDYRDSVIHRKRISAGMGHRELGNYLTRYRFAIPGLLFELHKLFKQRVPSKIIRAFHTYVVIKTD